MQLYYATHRAFSMDLHSQMALTDVYDFSMGLYLLVLVYSLVYDFSMGLYLLILVYSLHYAQHTSYEAHFNGMAIT
jgi:hypothetical protein